MNEDVRIRIIAEAITDAAVKSLHDLTRAEKELIGSVDSAKNALKSESDELNKQAGIIGNLEDKLTDLKLARKRSLDLDEIKKYNKEIASTEQEITKLTGSTQKSASAFQNLGKMLIGFIAVDKLIDMGKSLLTMTIETDRLQAAMRNAVDSSEEYAKSLAFLNKLSDDYGQNVNVLTKSYTSFVASSKSSNLSIEERQRIYASVVKAGSALKLSNDSIEGSLTALSQMFSKGNVQAEELRGQLGERLPGAFDMAAKAMGVSTMELNKMLEKGEVLAVDLLPKLATELDKTYGDKAKSNLETVGGAWNRLTNAVISYSSKINEATGFTKGVASVFNSLADNFSTVVKVVAAATAGFVTYQIAAKSSAVTSAALSLALKAKNLIIGESIVAYMALGGNVSRLSAAQLTAAASARTFNNVMLSTPWGIAITAAAALSGAYLIYRNRVNEANEEQARLSKEMADLKAPIVEQTTKFNYLANEILRGNLSVEEQIATLNKLKAKYPEILKGVTSLSEAERILKENKIKTSAQYDYRQKKLDELKAEFPNILKGITTVEEAEKSLGKILSIVNGEYEKRIQLAVNAYKSGETEKALQKAIQGYTQLQDLADKASKNTTTLGYGANGSAMAVTVESEADRIQKKADNAKKVMEQLMKQLDNYKSKSDGIAKSLVLNYSKEEEAAKKTATGVGKANKEKEKSTKTLQVVEEGYGKTLANVEKAMKSYMASMKTATDQELKDRKKVLDGSIKLLDQQYEYETKVNYLRKVATAKSTEEIERIEKEYFEETSRNELRSLQNRLDKNAEYIANLKVLIAVGKEGAAQQLIEAQSDRLKLQESYNAVSLEIAQKGAEDNKNAVQTGEEQTTKVIEEEGKKQLEAEQKKSAKRRQILENASAIVVGITQAALEVYNAMWEAKMDDANTATERALLENQQMWVNWGAQVVGVVDSFIQGGVINGVVSLIAWVGKGIANIFTASKRKAKAEMEDLKAYYQAYFEEWDSFMSGFGGDIEDFYGLFMNLNEVAEDYEKHFMTYDPKFLIDNELKRAKTIQATYDEATAKEKSYYDQQVKRVNDVYNAEVKRINDVYDLQQKLADQQFSAASNAILKGQADSLMGLISNKETLDSLESDYQAWYNRIEATFSLANKEITEGMSQAEIEAINAAKEAREAARTEALQWLIEELEHAAESEDQKRRIYSETEKLRNEAEIALDALRDEKTMKDIERNLNRQNELIEQEKVKNEALLVVEKEYNDKILELTLAKDKAMKESWEIVKYAILTGYDQMLAAANEAYSKGVITLEQLREIQAEIDRVRNKVGEMPLIKFDWDYNPYKFASGTESVPLGNNPKGIDTVPALLTEGERVLTAEQNKAIGNISNWDLVKLAQLSPLNGIPSFNVDPAHYQLIAEANALRNMGNTMDLMPLLSRIDGLESAIKGLPIQQFNITENGISKTIKKQNSIVEYHQKRYGV